MGRNGVDAAALRELTRLLTMPPVQSIGAPVVVDPVVLITLRELVPADEVVFNDLAPRRRSFWAESTSLCETSFPDDDCGEDVEFYEYFWRSDCSRPERTGDLSVTIGTDFSSLQEWRLSQDYSDLRDLCGGVAFDRTLLLPLPGPPGHSRRIRFMRLSGREFDDTDRVVATLVRPHLIAYLHALDLASRGTASLTTRQRQLTSLLAEGFSNPQIARTLGITPDTVRTHLQQIYARLGVASRGEAVALVSAPGNIVSLGAERGATRHSEVGQEVML